MPPKKDSLAPAIQRLREISGESQQFFSSLLRISTRAYQQYEQGQKIPEPRQLIAFATYADVMGQHELVDQFIAEAERQIAPPPAFPYYAAIVFKRREVIRVGPNTTLDVTNLGIPVRNR